MKLNFCTESVPVSRPAKSDPGERASELRVLLASPVGESKWKTGNHFDYCRAMNLSEAIGWSG